MRPAGPHGEVLRSASLSIAALLAGLAFAPTAAMADGGRVPDPTTILLWHLDEGSGTTAGDASGNARHGTIVSASWTAGKSGNGLGFAGGAAGSQYVQLSDSDALTPAALTIDLWIKPSRLDVVNQIILHKYQNGVPSNSDYALLLNGATLTFITRGGESLGTTLGSVATWYHVTAIANGASSRLYVDGVLAASGSLSSIPNGTRPLVLGSCLSSCASNNRTFAGTIDELRISPGSVPPPAPGVFNDFDGDRKSDPTVFNAPSGLWYSKLSSTGATATVAYGATGFSPVSGDYDGDGKSDRAVFYAGHWYIQRSSTGTDLSLAFGWFGYIPVPRDYDGDGKTDVAVYHEPTGLWYVRQSSTGTTVSLGFGGVGYTPVPGTYDSDGKADQAVFHEASGLWFILNSTTGVMNAFGFGGPGFVPVPRDYDGDGKTDPAVYHPPTGLWYVKFSTTGATVSVGYGGSAYFPAPGDYDGDGRTDIAVYHQPSGSWFLHSWSPGPTTAFGFGSAALEHVALSPLAPTVGTDSDGDAIRDVDEAYGTSTGLNLPGMGSHRLRKDILIEYDWVDDSSECAAHSHRPTSAMLDAITTAFAAAPLPNPSGLSGVNVIHDYGQGGFFTGGNLVTLPDPGGVLVGGVGGTSFYSTKDGSFAAARQGFFHYALLPHRLAFPWSDNTGQAELPGDDLVVSVACSHAFTVGVAGTIMHELGHNLGLQHGGFEGCNWKPNYNSVMNYRYQAAGVDTDCDVIGNQILDYSRGSLLELDENNLDENLGTCGPGHPIDWNRNGIGYESSISFDLNLNNASPPAPDNLSCPGWPLLSLSTLSDFDDWANIAFNGLADPDAPRQIVECEAPLSAIGRVQVGQ